MNLKGRDPHGIVKEGEYENVCDEIISVLYGIRDPKRRCPIAFTLKRNDAEMIGLYGDRVGDVVYGVAAGYIACLDPTDDLEGSVFLGALSQLLTMLI